MAILGHLIPAGGGESVPITSGTITIGRATECDIVIRHPSVSPKHCQLLFRGGSWFLRDLGSEHGTFVGRERCEKARVKSGSLLHIGTVQVELTVHNSRESDVQPNETSTDDDLALELLGAKPDLSSLATQAAASRSPKETVAQTSRSRKQPDSRQRLPKPAERNPQPTVAGCIDTSNPAKPTRRFLGILTPNAGGDPVPLMDEQIVIGRGRECGIRLKSSTVSTEHCRLEFRAGYWCVFDLDSHNGIRVDGQPTVEEWLMPGATLSVAKYRFEIDYKPRSDEPPPAFDVTTGKSLLEKAGLAKELDADHEPSWLVTDQDPEPEKRIDLESL